MFYPLASQEQIQKTPSVEDGIPKELEEDLRAFGCQLISQAGLLLKQKQVAVATAQILFQRFWYVSSMKQFGIGHMGMGALYLASKLEECPLRTRDIINVYDLLLQRTSHILAGKPDEEYEYTPMSYFGSTFYELKDAIVVAEMQLLKRLGFNMQVVLPYGTLVNYLRLLGLSGNPEVCNRAWGYLNDALQTPVYVLYQMPSIVSATILLAARQLEIALPSSSPNCWWELFDASWEDVWSICGYIMRLYRGRDPEDKLLVFRLIHKQDIRKWLIEHTPVQ